MLLLKYFVQIYKKNKEVNFVPLLKGLHGAKWCYTHRYKHINKHLWICWLQHSSYKEIQFCFSWQTNLHFLKARSTISPRPIGVLRIVRWVYCVLNSTQLLVLRLQKCNMQYLNWCKICSMWKNTHEVGGLSWISFQRPHTHTMTNSKALWRWSSLDTCKKVDTVYIKLTHLQGFTGQLTEGEKLRLTEMRDTHPCMRAFHWYAIFEWCIAVITMSMLSRGILRQMGCTAVLTAINSGLYIWLKPGTFRE